MEGDGLTFGFEGKFRDGKIREYGTQGAEPCHTENNVRSFYG